MELGVDPYAVLKVLDGGDVDVRAANLVASHAALQTGVVAGARGGRVGGRARRRPLALDAGAARDRGPVRARRLLGDPLRHARRHRARHVGGAARRAVLERRPGRLPARLQHHPDRTARQLAVPGRVRVDARAGLPLAHDHRGARARHRRRRARGDRVRAVAGAAHLPDDRHRRARPGVRARHGHGRARRADDARAAVRGPDDRERGRPVRDGPGRGVAAVRPDRASPPWPATASSTRRCPGWRCAAAATRPARSARDGARRVRRPRRRPAGARRRWPATARAPSGRCSRRRAALPAAVARRVLASTGPFARAARSGLADDARRAIAADELERLGTAAHGLDVRVPGERDGLRPRRPSWPPAPGWGRHAAALAAFHAPRGRRRAGRAPRAARRRGRAARHRAPGPDRADRPGRPRGAARRAARRPGRVLCRRARQRRASVRPARHRQVGHRARLRGRLRRPRPAADPGRARRARPHRRRVRGGRRRRAVVPALPGRPRVRRRDAGRPRAAGRARGRRRGTAAERARLGDVEPAQHDAHDALRAGRRDRRERGAGREDGAREPVRPARAVRRPRRGLVPRDRARPGGEAPRRGARGR